MKITLLVGLIILVGTGAGCSFRKQPTISATAPWEQSVGQIVTVEGKSRNAMMGAFLVADRGQIWIDGLEAWPADRDARKMRVTGTVIKRADLPVYIEKEGELPQQGIPVPEGTDLTAAATRYLLVDATWELAE